MAATGSPDKGDAAYLAVRPIISTDKGFYLQISTSTAASSNAIAAGKYAVALDKTSGVCFITWAASITAPTSGADPATTAIPVRDGDVIVAPGALKLAAILTGTGSTGSLGLVQIG